MMGEKLCMVSFNCTGRDSGGLNCLFEKVEGNEELPLERFPRLVPPLLLHAGKWLAS